MTKGTASRNFSVYGGILRLLGKRKARGIKVDEIGRDSS